MDLLVRPVAPEDRDWVSEFLRQEAGSPLQARRGAVFDATTHAGFLAEANGSGVGLATYVITGNQCELTTLYTNPQLAGAGTALLGRVIEEAKGAGCRRLWLITTNDNLDAMRFYQRRGFVLAAVYSGAVDQARRDLKPEIPLTGNFGIAIRDEVEFSMDLSGDH